jgi:hypothetical protein
LDAAALATVVSRSRFVLNSGELGVEGTLDEVDGSSGNESMPPGVGEDDWKAKEKIKGDA